jgi:hypothetical protein
LQVKQFEVEIVQVAHLLSHKEHVATPISTYPVLQRQLGIDNLLISEHVKQLVEVL